MAWGAAGFSPQTTQMDAFSPSLGLLVAWYYPPTLQVQRERQKLSCQKSHKNSGITPFEPTYIPHLPWEKLLRGCNDLSGVCSCTWGPAQATWTVSGLGQWDCLPEEGEWMLIESPHCATPPSLIFLILKRDRKVHAI